MGTSLLAGLLLSVVVYTSSYAEDINYRALETQGYGDVADILRDMTPEQRAEVLRQATMVQKDIENMTPEERYQLEVEMQQLNDVLFEGDTTYDAQKLDPSKSKDLEGIRSDIDAFHKSRQQGD